MPAGTCQFSAHAGLIAAPYNEKHVFKDLLRQVSSNPTQPRSAYKISSQKIPGSTPGVTINLPLYLYSEPGSVVSTATGYGLDGPGIEPRWGQDFPHLSRPALGHT